MSADATPGLVLDDVLDLKAATPLTDALRGLRGADLALDAAAVRRVGGQCLQVLLAAQAAWLEDGHALTITNPSSEFIEGVTLLGAASLAGQAGQDTYGEHRS